MTLQDLKAQYQMDEQVHPTGHPWLWWQCYDKQLNVWHDAMCPLMFDGTLRVRRKECAPTVYDDHGVVRVLDDDTCDGWEKSISPSATVETWAAKLVDDPNQMELLEDMVNHPEHYAGQGDIECIEVLEQLARDGHDFRVLNAIKYLWRYRHKGRVESLQKAMWYLNRVIDEMEIDE